MGYVSLRIRSLGIRSLCIQSVDRKLFLLSAIFLTTMQYAGVLPKEIINQLTEASSNKRYATAELAAKQSVTVQYRLLS